jgi:hypothetical protein
MRKSALAVITAMVFLFPVLAVAGSDVPDLKGVWKGTVHGIKHGTGDEKAHKKESELGKKSSLDMTLTIEAQDGRVISGTHASPRDSEKAVGVIRGDNKTVLITDEDGFIHGKLLAPDKMEVVYMEAGPVQVISLGTYTKQK